MELENKESVEFVESQHFDVNELTSVRDIIESMSKFNQVEVLRLLSKHKCVTLNENKYGVHINLSDLTKDIVYELKMYINYVNTQEINLNSIEKQKEDFKNIYFTKDNKDINVKNYKYASTAC
jgi:DNA integrity scanning protein DisA with diadenylate cyclase activity